MKISINELARIYYGGGLAVGTKLYAEKDGKYTWVIYCGYLKWIGSRILLLNVGR